MPSKSGVSPEAAVDDVFEDEVQVDFVFLWMDDGLAKRFVKRTKLTLSPLL